MTIAHRLAPAWLFSLLTAALLTGCTDGGALDLDPGNGADVASAPTSVTASSLPVTVEIVGPGGGLVRDSAGHACTGTCTTSHPAGTTLALLPTATSGPFQGFTRDCTGTACTLVVNAARAVRAVFGHLAVVQAIPVPTHDPYDRVNDMVVGPDGDVFVVGDNYRPGELGTLAVPCPGFVCGYVARIDGRTGTPRWVRSFGGDSSDAYASGIALRNGHLYIASTFAGQVSYGTTRLVTIQNATAIVSMSLDGQVEWARGFFRTGDFGSSEPQVIAASDDGRLFVAGRFDGAVDFGGVIARNLQPGFSDGYILGLEAASGTTRWVRVVDSTDNTEIHGLGTDPVGNLVVAGNHYAPVNLGGGPIMPAPAFPSPRGIFVAKLRGSDGAHVWSRGLTAPFLGSMHKAVVDESGDVFLSAFLGGALDLGDGVTVANTGDDPVFVARLNGATGRSKWAVKAGTAHLADVRAGQVLLVGGGHALELALLDATTGAVRQQRRVAGDLEGGAGLLFGGSGVLAGDHAYGVIDFWNGAGIDGLSTPPTSVSSVRERRFVRIGL